MFYRGRTWDKPCHNELSGERGSFKRKLHSLYTPFLKKSKAVLSIRSARPSKVEKRVIEKGFQVLEVDRLFVTLTVSTIAGQATLHRSLA